MKEKDKDDIFEQAAKESFKDFEKSNEITKQKDQLDLAIERTDNPIDSSWVKVEKAMNGRFAERFIQAMDGLPDKDFIRIYLKSLEYFKPKVIREESIKDEQKDLNINVNLVSVNEDGEIIELHLNKENTYE